MNFNKLLPEELSDKEAYCFAELLMGIVLTFESQHCAQIRRYIREREQEEFLKCYDISDDEYPF